MRAGSLTLRTARDATTRFIQQIAALPSRAAQLWQRLQPSHFPIAYKLALTITLVISVGMSLLGMVVVDNQTRLLRQQMAQFGQALISQMAETVKEPLLAGDALTLRLAAGGMMRHDGVRGAVIYSDDLAPIASAGLTPPAAQLQQLLQQSTDSAAIAAVEWQSQERGSTSGVIAFFTPIVVRELITGYVLLTFDHSQLSQAQRDTLRAVTTATLLMVLLGAVAAILLGQRLSRPINDLMDASLQISRGDYSFRFAERRNDELGTLMQAFNTMSDGLLRKEQVEQVFSRYVSPKVAREVLSDLAQVQLGGQHVEASVLFADIAGFTALSERLTPQEISTLLNDYFGVIAEAAQAYQGHVDKYMGDCAMLVFGVPEPDAEHTLNAVCCAVLIQRLIGELNRQREASGQIPLHFHVSCNSGTMLAGNMGSHDRMDYTVVGDAVNLASRLSTVAEADQIIISKVMHNLPILAGKLISREHDTIRLRGKQQPVATVEVLDLTEPLRSRLEQHYHHILRQPQRRHTA